MTKEQILAQLLHHSVRNISTGCLEHQYKPNTHGYVYVRVNGGRYRIHRLVYTLIMGEPKYKVLHRCDNKICWEITHLYDGTSTQNVDDMLTRKRNNPIIVHGAEVVRKVKELENSLTQREIASIAGMSQGHVSRILRGVQRVRGIGAVI